MTSRRPADAPDDLSIGTLVRRGLVTPSISLVEEAIRKSDVDALRCVMDSGIDLSRLVPDPNGKSIYHYAVRNQTTEVSEFLLANSIKFQNFYTVFLDSITAECKQHFALLLPYASPQHKVYGVQHAARRRKVEFIELILESGLDVNVKCADTRPLLFYLLEFPETLVGRHVDFQVCDWEGRSACHAIAESLTTTAATLIFAIQNGADPDQPNNRGYTPWDYYVCMGYPLTTKTIILFLAGSKPSAKSKLDAPGLRVWDETWWREKTTTARCMVLSLNDNTWTANEETKQIVCSTAYAIIGARGATICIALQTLDLPALVTCEILQAYFVMWPRIPFHCYWKLVTTIKHFR